MASSGDKKLILVTGASRGLGLEFVRQYAARGDKILATCRNPLQASELQELAQAYPDQIEVIELDVTDEHSFNTARDRVRALENRLDVLINNAGTFASGETGLMHLDGAKMLHVFHANAIGPVLLTRALLEPLRNAALAGSFLPRVVNLTSGGESLPDMTTLVNPQYSYKASKYALAHFIRTLAGELKNENIVVVGMGPGFVLTDMTRYASVRPPLMPEESVCGMVKCIDSLTLENAGDLLSWDSQI